MQYLLSEEEYAALTQAAEVGKRITMQQLGELCRDVANHKPTFTGWDRQHEARPWKCIRDSRGEWYCDECPVQKMCTYPHHYSK